MQTLAALDLPPDEMLHHLDEHAPHLGSDHETCGTASGLSARSL
ncbi:hypothetical protein [Streptomyces sp. NPDC059649]